MRARRILLIYAHPTLEKSRVNLGLLRGAAELDGVTVHDLYDRYPDFDVDGRRERELLAAHDVLVVQHPFYWYAAPPLVDQWKISTLTHGWAYGRGGVALHGKTWLSVITTGGSEDDYQPDGVNRFTMRELLAPVEQGANLCGMEFLAPFVVHDTRRITRELIDAAAADYRRVLEALRDGRLDREAARGLARLNADLSLVVRD